MTPQERYDALYRNAVSAYGLVLEKKADKWYWKAVGALLGAISFGKIDFMNSFFTTFANRIGVSPSWDEMTVEEKYVMLLHETEHMRQYTVAGFGSIWLGFVLSGIGYLLLPFPVGLAYVRAYMEMQGYAQTIRGTVQMYGKATAEAQKDFIVRQFTSWNYLFMWPFPDYMNRWYENTLARILKEEGHE